MKYRLMAFIMALVAIFAGVLVNYFGDRLMNYLAPPPGLRLELFWGVATFNPVWILDLFLVPFIAGIVVSLVYGLGGKVLCYFVPIIVRIVSYIEMMNYKGLPDGVTLLPFWYWILVLIVAIEAAAFGGAFGEIIVKKTYGRRPRHMVYKDSSDSGNSSKT
jgi:hypothetical protein